MSTAANSGEGNATVPWADMPAGERTKRIIACILPFIMSPLLTSLYFGLGDTEQQALGSLFFFLIIVSMALGFILTWRLIPSDAKFGPGPYVPAIPVRAPAERARIPPAMKWAIFQRDGYQCIYCGRSGGIDAPLEVDHVIPVSSGGETTPQNLVTACRHCNRRKGATHHVEENVEHGLKEGSTDFIRP